MYNGVSEGEGGIDVGDGEGRGAFERGGSEAKRGRERLRSTVRTPTFGRACERFVLDVS
jgi:hypothetical protein